MNVLQYLDNPALYHVILLAKTGSEGERKNGIAHVAEHVCLAPIFESCNALHQMNLLPAGSTCPHYMLLYVVGSNSNKKWIDEWVCSVLNSSIVTNRNMSIAKQQVLCECETLKHETNKKKEIVRYVTGDNERPLPIGTVENIKSISNNDIETWLCGTFKKNYWCFTFNSIQEIWGLYHPIMYIEKENIIQAFQNGGGNKLVSHKLKVVYDLSTPQTEAEYLFPLPTAHSKQGLLLLMFMEEFLRYALNKACPFAVTVNEKFFSQHDGYLSIKLNLPASPCSDIEVAQKHFKFIRETLEVAEYDLSLFVEALSVISLNISNSIRDIKTISASEQWSCIMNSIIYDRPIWNETEFMEVFEFLTHIDFSTVSALKKYIYYPETLILHRTTAESTND